MVDGQFAVVRYIGFVQFALGMWLGVELETAIGKNDGLVDGTRYFRCAPNHGLFCRPNRASWHGKRVSELLES